MAAKKEFVVRWNTLAGGFHDSDLLEEAIAFGKIQASYLIAGTTWHVINRSGRGEIVANGP